MPDAVLRDAEIWTAEVHFSRRHIDATVRRIDVASDECEVQRPHGDSAMTTKDERKHGVMAQYPLRTRWRKMTGEALRFRPYATTKDERKYWQGDAISSPYAMTKNDGWSDEISSIRDDERWWVKRWDLVHQWRRWYDSIQLSLTVAPSSSCRPACRTLSAKQTATAAGQLSSVAGL